MHYKYTNDDVDTLHLHLNGRVAYNNMHWTCAHLSTAFHDAHLTFLGSSSERISLSPTVINMAHSPWFDFSLSTSTFSSCLSPSSSATSSCSLSSTARSSWQTCAAPLQKRVRTPWTPSPLTHFLTVKVLEDTPAVLSLGKLCDENGYSYEWINGQKPHLIKNGIRIICNTENFVPIVVPGLSSSSSGSSSTSRTPMKQESHSSSSSSSSPSSPTVSESETREREDRIESDISPVTCVNYGWWKIGETRYWSSQ